MASRADDGLTRSRTGCWTCRARRIKCDEKRPICQRCARNNFSCGYGLRLIWLEDTLAKGTCHGRAGVWSKNRSSVDASGKNTGVYPQQEQKTRDGMESEQIAHHLGHARFLNTTSRDLWLYLHFDEATEEKSQDQCEIDEAFFKDLHLDDQHGLPYPSSLSLNSFRSESSNTDGILLSFYEAVICSTSTLLDDEQNNPYRYVILPMALHSQSLYHATLAISANTLRLKYPGFAVIALEHRQKALKGLIRILKQDDIDGREEDEMLGLALMLCWFDISDGCRSTWVNHLNSFHRLMHRRRQRSSHTSSLHSQNLDQFFTRYFAFHLVIAKTAFRVDDMVYLPISEAPPSLALSNTDPGTSHSPEDNPSLLSGQPSSENEDAISLQKQWVLLSPSTYFLSLSMPSASLNEIDPYMGFSNALLLLLNEVAELSQQLLASFSCSNPPPEDEAILIQAKVNRLRTSLETLQQIPPSLDTVAEKHNESTGQKVMREPVLIATAEAYRLAALLFLHETCSPSSSSVIATVSHSPPLLDEGEKKELLANVLDLLDRNIADMLGTAALPLWPLFIAGCCVTEESDRNIPLRIFSEAEGQKRFGNVKPAREVVQMVWRQSDLAQDDRSRAQSSNASRKDVKSRDTKKLRARTDRYEWERAMAMLGDWKISLT